MIVSVVLATYNRAELIGKAIESVLSQTFADLELIVVNDASSDHTLEVVLRYAKKDPRIRVFTNEHNAGQVKSLNRGIKESQGKYVARIDDDDVWCDPKKLEKQVGFLESHLEYVLVGGGIIIVNEEGKEMVRFLHPKEDKEIRDMILMSAPFAHGAVVFRKDACDKVEGYNEHMEYGEDWDLWLKLGKVGKMANVQDYVLLYRKSLNRKTSNWRNETKYDNALRKAYCHDYPNYYKARLFGFLATVYYALPFVRNMLYPLSAKLRELFFKASRSLWKKF